MTKRGSLLLRTANTIRKVKAKDIYRVGIKLSWKVKAMIRVSAPIFFY